MGASIGTGSSAPLLSGRGLIPCVGIACWGWRSVVGRVCSGSGEVSAVGDIDIIPELCGGNTGCGWWSGVPVCPSIIISGRGDGSYVSAHFESPDTAANRAYVPGEGVLGTYGIYQEFRRWRWG